MSRTLLVDATHLLHRSAAAQARILGSETPVFGPATVGTVVGLLRQAVAHFLPLSVILVWDGERSERRKAIFPEYKGNRTPLPPDHSQRKWLDIARCSRVFRKLGCRSLLLQKKEADDVIGFLAKKLPASIIVSSDRDFLQLVQHGAACWLLDQEKYISGTNFFEEFQVLPTQFLLLRAVLGDSSDAIPKVLGVGPKTILPLLQTDPKITTFPALQRLLESKEKLSKKEQTLLGSKDVVERNLNLLDVLQEVFTPEEIQEIDTLLSLRVGFEEKAIEDIEPLGMKVIDFWTDWSSPFRRLL